MEHSEIIYMATKCVAKRWDYDQLYYCDDLFNEEELDVTANEIWDFVEEINQIGRDEFARKYDGIKFFHSF